MERLTIDTDIRFCDIAQCRETPGGSFCEDGYCDQRRVYERLREYERLGDIDELTTLAKARDDGRVAVLPCKTGVTAWNIKSMFSFCSEPKEEVIDRFVVSDGGVDVAFRSGYKFSVERIGKTVFLTRAEAEAALEGETNGDS